jgi:hypothetical protein
MYSPDQEFLGVSEVNEVGLQPIVVLNPINWKTDAKRPPFNL